MERDFITFLNNDLKEMREKNPMFSLRAYAKRVGVHPATLSRLMNRKRRLMNEVIVKIGLKIGLPEEEMLKFIEANSKNLKTNSAVSINETPQNQDVGS